MEKQRLEDESSDELTVEEKLQTEAAIRLRMAELEEKLFFKSSIYLLICLLHGP